MTKLTGQVREFMEKAKQSLPSKPSIPDDQTRILRVRLLLEEVLELAEASGVSIAIKTDNSVFPIEKHSTFDCVCVEEPDLLEVADALGDIAVVNEGANLAWGLDGEAFTDAIMENNFTKFVDGWIDEHGKLRKGPSYKPVDLRPVLDKQLNG